MSDLILQWLNDEVQLSRKVVNFEKDFENGFLIGELLHKYNQQLNFQDFKDDNNRDVKIRNFHLIFPTLKCLKVSFDSTVCEKIIANQKDVAKNILYQIKMALEKVHNPADKLLLGTKTTGIQSINPQKKIKVRKDQYETMEGEFFVDMLNKGQRSQMLINQEKHLEKFQKFKEQQDILIEDCRRLEREEEQKVKEEIRKIQLDKLQRNQTFMDDWKKKGLENWRINRKKQKLREEEDRAFKEEEMKNKREKTLLLQTVQRKEILEELDDFEGKLQTQQQQQLTSSRFQQQQQVTNEMTATQTLNKLKEQKLLSEFQKKERDKRRRKMIVDQARNQKQFEVKQREQQILDKLNRRSRQEQELQYEEWRCLQSYDLIQKSRDLREDKYRKRKELIQLNCKYKEEQLLQRYQQQYHHQVTQYQHKQKTLMVDQKQSKRKDNYQLCEQILQEIMGIQESLFWNMQDNDLNDIQVNGDYEQAVMLFLKGAEQVPRINRGDQLEHKQSQQAVHFQLTSQQLYQQYILKGFAAIQLQAIPLLNKSKDKHKEEQEEQKEGEQENSHKEEEKEIEYQYKLFDILQDLRQQEKNIRELELKESKMENIEELDDLEKQKQLLEITMSMEEEKEEKEKEDRIPILISVIGKDQSGKEEITTWLHQNLGYTVLTVETLLQPLFNNHNQSDINNNNYNNNNNQQLTELEQNIKDDLLKGCKLDNQQIADLVFNNIIQHKQNKAEGLILLDFPQNQEQWQYLQKHQQKEKGKEEKKEEKEKQLETVLSRPTETKEEKENEKQMIDLVVHLDKSDEECLQKQFGRMWDERSGQEYHLEDNKPQVDNYPLIEHLVKQQEVKNSEGILINRLVGFSQALPALQQSLQGYHRITCIQQLQPIVHSLKQATLHQQSQQLQYRQQLKHSLQQAHQHIQQSIQHSKRFSVTEQDSMTEQLQQLQQLKSMLPVESIRYLLQLISSTDHHHSTHIQQCLVQFQLQDTQINHQWAEVQRRFIEQLETADDKIVKVINYQKQYNLFLLRNPDMITEEATKEEMHMRVGDLEQDLWEMAENKKNMMIQQRQLIVEQQLIEKYQEQYIDTLTQMVVYEHSRHQMTNLIIQDYYHLLQGKEVVEINKDNIRQLNLSAIKEERMEDIDNHSCPRLNKLFEEAARNHSQEDEEQLKQEQAKNNKNTKTAKKDTKKEQQQQVVTQENEAGGEVEREKEILLEVEQQIYKGRLDHLQTQAIAHLASIRHKGTTVYNKLEDWVDYCFQVETTLIDQVATIFRDNIEMEQRIQNEVSIHNFQVVVSSKTLNYLTQPPVILPAKEKQTTTRFTVSQLYLFIEDLKQMAYESHYIDNNHLLQYLSNKTKQLNIPDLPLVYLSLDKQSLMKLIYNLDKKSTGSINIKHIAVYFSLLDTPIIKLDEYLQYEQNLLMVSDNKETIGQDQFTQIPCFFDAYEEEINITENQRSFQRQKLLKELLFYILKDQNTDELNIQEYLEILNCTEYLQDDLDKDRVQTYKSLIFN